MSHLADEEISSFFDWLIKNISTLNKSLDIQQEMTKKIKSIHSDLHWEIGPLSEDEKYLAFSPNLNENLLNITRNLVEKSPKISGWKFLCAKPKKNWNNRSIKFRSNKNLKNVTCDNWQYFLTSFNDDEFFDVNIVPDKKLELTKNELNYIADLFVEFELGEELYIQAIDQVNVLEVGSNPEDTNSVEVLYEHILDQWKRIH